MSSIQSVRSSFKRVLETQDNAKVKRLNTLNKNREKNLQDLTDTKITRIGTLFIVPEIMQIQRGYDSRINQMFTKYIIMNEMQSAASDKVWHFRDDCLICEVQFLNWIANTENNDNSINARNNNNNSIENTDI